jgi:spermidine/putrescine transport system ATP-binding protein
VNEPEVLLLDDPLGALDLKLRQTMQYELKDLQSRVGITFVYVTHDQEEALTMSDRIGVMSEGHLLQIGDSHEIYERPTSRFVADFIGDINIIEGEVSGAGSARLSNGVDVGIPAGHPVSGKVTLALRPERLALHPVDEPTHDGRNRLRGRVTRRTYFGDVYYYDVEAGFDEPLDVKEENRPDVGTHEVGDEVIVSWRAEAANLVSD